MDDIKLSKGIDKLSQMVYLMNMQCEMLKILLTIKCLGETMPMHRKRLAPRSLRHFAVKGML